MLTTTLQIQLLTDILTSVADPHRNVSTGEEDISDQNHPVGVTRNLLIIEQHLLYGFIVDSFSKFPVPHVRH